MEYRDFELVQIPKRDLDRLRQERKNLMEALIPFYCPDWTDEKGWTDSIGKDDRIWDLFGPSDFHKVQSVIEDIMNWKW